MALATFAGGCFWCMQPAFSNIKGVSSVISGYTGGKKANPTYEEVCSGTSGHVEAVQIEYDPLRVRYEKLLDTFFQSIDPTDDGGQFADRGKQYESAIFYHDEEQREKAEASKKSLDQSGKFDGPIVTKILPAKPFYPAEAYHQDYAKKNPAHYNAYKVGSGREAYLRKMWKK